MKNNKYRKYLLTLATFAIMLVCVGVIYTVVHAQSIQITKIDYENLTLTVQASDGDSKIFYTTSKNATNWDEIPDEPDENHQVTMDISWISMTKDVTLYLKGNQSTDPISVVLPKQNNKFKASLDLSSSTFKFSNVGTSGKIYWRKSTSTEWTEFNQDDQTEMQNLLESFSLKGISLVFETGQVQGTSADKPGERPSKISTVKVAKRASAPSVSLNYNTMIFTVKNTMEYKLSEEDKWIPVNTTKLNLGDVMPDVLYDNKGKDMEEDDTVGIDFRVRATASKVASQTKTLEICGQEDTLLDNIQIAYTGPTQLKILIDKKEITKEDGTTETLKEASTDNPYEYTVVKSGDELDIYNAKWIGITTNETKVSSTTAPEGSTIYVRKKATGNKLPGKEHAIGEAVHYIDASSLQEQKYALEKIQGVKKELTFVICVSSKEAEVSSVTFNGTKAGFKASKPQLQESGDKYLITVTINDTSAIENISDNLGTEMTAEITLSNTEVINKGVTLYIQKAASLENKSYTTYADYGFIGGNADNGDLTFVIALNKEKAEELAKAELDNISYNGKVIESSQYTVTERNEDNEITVTIPKDNISALGKKDAGYVSSNKYGTPYSLKVTLKNGEILENVKLTIEYPVKVSSSSSSFIISKSSLEEFLKEVENANKANSDDDPDNNVTVPTTYTNPEITYTIQQDIYELDSSYSLTGLNWKGTNVLATGSGAAGIFQVTVDLKKLAKAEIGSDSLVLTLTNDEGKELLVDYGYRITLTE